jgi:hypothetical protein
MRHFFALPLVIVILASDFPSAFPNDPAKRMPSLEDTYRAWHAGLASKKREERQKTLRSMMPTQKDVEYLLPKYAKKLWPRLEPEIEFLVKNADAAAREWTRGSELKSFEVINVREDENASNLRKRLLAIIPNDVPIFEVYVHVGKDERRKRGFFMYVHKRWMWLDPLSVNPAALEKLK